MKFYYVDINQINDIPNFKYNDSYLLKDRIESKVAYLLLKYALKENGIDINDVRFNYNKNGKPLIASHNVYFSISHSYNIVAVALSSIEIGIDVELYDKGRDINRLVKKILNVEELNEYNNIDCKYSYFYTKWTQKEAYIKKRGISIIEGFNYDLSNIKSINIYDDLNNLYITSMTEETTEIKKIDIKSLI